MFLRWLYTDVIESLLDCFVGCRMPFMCFVPSLASWSALTARQNFIVVCSPPTLIQHWFVSNYLPTPQKKPHRANLLKKCNETWKILRSTHAHVRVGMSSLRHTSSNRKSERLFSFPHKYIYNHLILRYIYKHIATTSAMCLHLRVHTKGSTGKGIRTWRMRWQHT